MMRSLYLLALGLLLPLQSAAFNFTSTFNNKIDTCVTNELNCGADPATYLASYITDLQSIFMAILVIMIVYYGVRAVFSSHSGNYQETSMSLAYAFAATVLVLSAGQIASVFTASGSPEPINSMLITVLTTLKALLGIAIVVSLFIQGVQLLTAFGTDRLDQVRKKFGFLIVGIIFVLLAVPIVESIMGVQKASLGGPIKEFIYFLAVIFGLLLADYFTPFRCKIA
jgi:type IV secretory pathway VirB2 component (pilin)